jgi:tRNA 2-(methylsulfanyl)-N6-isopentenyladenosine37 hydroxylase
VPPQKVCSFIGHNGAVKLKVATSPRWIEAVLSDFDAFLLDHAACERKASATAMSFVAHYPDRRELVRAMIELAQEELEHFGDVYRRVEERGLVLAADTKDPYVGRLLKELRDGSEVYFLDRLLIAGIVEARGCERFGIVAETLPAGPMKDFYRDIAVSEARHRGLFGRLARIYFDEETVNRRTEELLSVEAQIVAALPFRAAVH